MILVAYRHPSRNDKRLERPSELWKKWAYGFAIWQAIVTPVLAKTAASVIDAHVHLAALPDGQNGCLMSNKIKNGIVFRYLAWRLGLPMDYPAEANRLYIDRLVLALKASQDVRQAVILGMDGVYDSQGELDRANTDFLISNDYVFSVVDQHPDLFKAGVSINPQRRDAVAELERCAKKGAVLVKILPNAQQFNPANPAYVPFYRAMARLHIALLCHVGYEYALIGKDQTLGDPRNLQLALDQGVTVIAAHAMSNGLFFREPYWDTLVRFVRKYPQFYWDASAMSLPNRIGMLLRIRRHPELARRMIYGTDYPMPEFAIPALLVGDWRGYRDLWKMPNPFDRHFRLLEIMGFPHPRGMEKIIFGAAK
ncbi:MAG TPA: amidohydrolase family protein [Elusimicrobiota bacterium]|nr:amidohydrolase family protein [Elusimicrobiota bacterium]